MVRGFVTATSVRRSDKTRLEWFETRPLIASVGGRPMTGYGSPGCVEGYRCGECGTVVIR
jgi:hypothetical protein